MSTPPNCPPLLSLAVLGLAACGGCPGPEQASDISSSTSAADASQGGSGAADASLDADAAKPLKPCNCPDPDYWLKVEGDGDAQVFPFPNPAIPDHNCQPTRPSGYTYLPDCQGTELYVIAACAGQGTESGCIFLNQRDAPYAQYIDRSGTTWALSNPAIEIEPPPGTLYPPWRGRYSATANSANNSPLLLHGTFRVCYLWTVGTVC
ncbi:MAG: hypothetical protein HY744_25175 [Deltaproteobacteria bacterium]|nr:hypothetical protein [Deltaproteobacteria bacterium]